MGPTHVDEIADGIYRINTAVEVPVGAFSFNQYLIADDEPLLFHSGPRRLFPSVRDAVARVLPLEDSEAFRRQLDYYSHTANARMLLARLAATEPATLACMHGSAWRGDGAALLEALADALTAEDASNRAQT